MEIGPRRCPNLALSGRPLQKHLATFMSHGSSSFQPHRLPPPPTNPAPILPDSQMLGSPASPLALLEGFISCLICASCTLLALLRVRHIPSWLARRDDARGFCRCCFALPALSRSELCRKLCGLRVQGGWERSRGNANYYFFLTTVWITLRFCLSEASKVGSVKLR